MTTTTAARRTLQVPVTVTPAVSCDEAVDILQSLGYDQLPVVGDDNAILGVVTEGNLTSKLMSGRVKAADSVTKAFYPQFRKVTNTTKLSELARIFDRDHFAVVVTTQRCYTRGKDQNAAITEKSVVVGVVSRIDLLKFITSNEPSAVASSPGAAAAAAAGGAGAGTAGGAAAPGSGGAASDRV
jgi:cystathionine beta-synthase